jgi:hypothetical protein
MSLAVGEGCVAIVRRVDEGAPNRFVGYGVDHRAVNNVRLVFELLVLPGSRYVSGISRKKDDQDKP